MCNIYYFLKKRGEGVCLSVVVVVGGGKGEKRERGKEEKSEE